MFFLVLFNDLKMAEQILKEQKPGKIKACGRKVKGFIDHVWTIKCQDVVKKGNLAKVCSIYKELSTMRSSCIFLDMNCVFSLINVC